MNKYVLNELSQDVVNKIAAGEVVERPSSVVKELVDNSIDAGATKIQIKVVNGGIDLIEVSDNGSGIPKESLADIFRPHTTSKISSLEDLNNLLTMGFRGEALSTIVSVSDVVLSSKYIDSDSAFEIEYRGINDFSIKKTARESGTVVTVRNIFANIPARRKYLKTAQTEYKKILDILYPYFLIYPNIHFTLIKDEKKVFDLINLPNTKAGDISKERVKEVLKGEFTDRMLKLFFNGNSIEILGLTAHPQDHQKTTANQYIFVNNRPIWDSGVAKAVIQGYERYIPFGERVPFIINIKINPDQIDVNVHPRKEEIRFLNPFRVYASVTEAVSKAVRASVSYKIESEFKPAEFTSDNIKRKEYTNRNITFSPNQSASVRDSLLFSKEVLNESSYIKTATSENTQVDEKEGEGIRNIFQIFNKYIVIEFENDILWIIDQHAAAERINFEKFKKAKEGNIDKQNLLVPVAIPASENELVIFDELKSIFSDLGFDYKMWKDKIIINSVPVEFVNTDFKKLFDEIFSLGNEQSDVSKGANKLKEDILATMACHASVRSGQSLHREEMIDIYKRLMQCENPYSCPHGRPAVWKLKLSEIDSNFERTY